MDVSEGCLLVLLQCRKREWFGDHLGNEAWAWEAAQRCLHAGFAVLRVATENWADVKQEHPEWFEPLFRENLCRQHVICSINFIHCLIPVLKEVHEVLQQDEEDNVERCRRHGLYIYVPEGVSRVSTDLYVVCEASSNVGSDLSPFGLRRIYSYYSEPLLWCGFNMASQSTGTKGFVGDVASLITLGQVLERLLLYHIDQTCKALRGVFLGLVNRNHICFGFLCHRSQCCNNSAGDAAPMSKADYTPTPVIPDQVYYLQKKAYTVEEVLEQALGVTSRVRGSRDSSDVVCLRLRTYMQDDDPILQKDNSFVDGRLAALRQAFKTSKMAQDSRRLQSLVEGEDNAVRGDLQAALGVLETTAQTMDEQQEHEVMNWCKDKGWLQSESDEWMLLAMIHRGLIRDPCDQFLTCVHHKKQMHDYKECVRHFSEYRTFHLSENPSLEDLAANLQTLNVEEATGGSALLERFFGHFVISWKPLNHSSVFTFDEKFQQLATPIVLYGATPH